ncbi:hypothetical protein ALC57_15237 [Trachymyrmex cornetzi]|uniref:Uncharacterized protein n=1 Tax=Trachymyrmex cornetzi TaxID=471704 RepID=A0A195DHY9_9HYME|nr:hypothetical protein ALC57_15237 [Trachymyrmex cornetzi]
MLTRLCHHGLVAGSPQDPCRLCRNRFLVDRGRADICVSHARTRKKISSRGMFARREGKGN